MINNIKISIITVCYNAENELYQTLMSVKNQTYKNIEHVIIDGKSKDNSLNIVKNYKTNINYECVLVSEKDNGIYDAMNKGINNSTGEIIYFLNAGDILEDNDVLAKVIRYFQENKDYSIIYGNMKLSDKLQIVKYEELTDIFFLKGKVICHQCIFCRKSVFEIAGKFDLNYKICADRDWLLRCFKLNLRIKHIDVIIVTYDTNGMSSSKENSTRLRKESDLIILKYYNIMFYIAQKIRHLIKDAISIIYLVKN